MRLKPTLVGLALSVLMVSMAIDWTDATAGQSPTDIREIQPSELERVKYLARAYVYEPQDFQAFEKTCWEYEDFRPFYNNKIEIQIDDYDASQIKDELFTEYDIIVLTTPRDTLSQHDKSILEEFEASKGIVMPSGRNAYKEISAIRCRFESSQLRSKQEIYIWEYHSTNLDIYYPEVEGWFTLENAQKNAAVLEQFYRFAEDVVDERPFHGGKISIAFFKYRWMSMAGQIVRMGILREESNLFPPGWAFYHELTHDFTGYDGPGLMRTSTAGYVSINIAFGETMAQIFAYYFDSTFKYDMGSVQEMKSFWASKLQEYENNKVDPYALNWHGHNEDQRHFEAMIFYISETYGWQTWNFFFRIAKQSDIPQPDRVDMEDLAQKDASLAFSRFVYLLSLAAGEDLRPLFKNWRFKIEPEVESLKVYRVSHLELNLSSSSVNVGDVLTISVKITDVDGNPIQNQKVDFYFRSVGESPKSIGNATTDSSGHAKISLKAEIDAGRYEVVAFYRGSKEHGQREERATLTVHSLKPMSDASKLIANAEEAIRKAEEEGRTAGLDRARQKLAEARSAYYSGLYDVAISLAKQALKLAEIAVAPTTTTVPKLPAQPNWLQTNWFYMAVLATVTAIAIILLTKLRSKRGAHADEAT